MTIIQVLVESLLSLVLFESDVLHPFLSAEAPISVLDWTFE